MKPQAAREAAQEEDASCSPKAEKVYLAVVDFDDLEWATAALYRVGEVYDEFAEALRDARRPPGVTRRGSEQYRDALDVYVVDIQEKAVERFGAGYKKAIEMQVYDEYTAKIREALGRLAASKFPPEQRGARAACGSAIGRRLPSWSRR